MSNPKKDGLIASLFGALFGMLFELLGALIGGIVRSPVTAAEKLTLPVTIREASPSEVIELRHRVLRAGRPRNTAIFEGDDEASTRHWVAVRRDEIIGVATVMARPCPDVPDARWQLRGMAIDPGQRGLGIGRALLEHLHGAVTDPMWCNARTSAAGFYEKSGWKPVSEVFEITGIGPHRRLEYRR